MILKIFFIIWFILIVTYLLRNAIFSMLPNTPSTPLDFLMSDEDLSEYEKACREFAQKERELIDLEDLDSHLKQISKQTRRNKDGSFDRRSQNGKLLNHNLPLMPKKLSEAKKEVRLKKWHLDKYLHFYDDKKSSWISHHSFNFAFHRSFWTAILFVYGYHQSGVEQASLLIWFSVLIFFTLKIWFSRKLHDLIELEENKHNLRAYLPQI